MLPGDPRGVLRSQVGDEEMSARDNMESLVDLRSVAVKGGGVKMDLAEEAEAGLGGDICGRCCQDGNTGMQLVGWSGRIEVDDLVW